MRARRPFILLAACVSLLGSAVACSGGSGGSPLAPDTGGTDPNAPVRDTTPFMVGGGR